MDERSAALGSLRSFAIIAWVGVSLCAPCAPARAQEQPEALIVLPACPGGFGGLRLRRLLILELTDAGVASLELRTADDPEIGGAAVTVSLEASCADDGVVTLAVTGGPGEPNVRQQLDLSEVDATARPRAIAVAAAEQVRLQRLLAERAPPSAPASVDAPPEVVRRAPPTVRSEIDVEVPPRADAEADAPDEPPSVPIAGALFAAFEARGFPELATWPVGARVGAWLRVLEILRIGFDLGPGFTSAEHPAGRVETWLVTVGFSLGARWAVTPELGITPALRLDVGYASFSGFAEVARSTRGEGVALALLGSATFDIALGSRVGLLIELEVGSSVVAHVALAGDEAVAGTQGVALGLRSGFLFHL